jgi:hypothetical protein
MSKLFGYLSYRDVDAAITWLEGLGFEATMRQQDNGGATIHAELRLGDAGVMVAPVDEPYETPNLIGRSTGRGLYLLVMMSPHSMGQPCRRAAAASSRRRRRSGEPSVPASSIQRATSGLSGLTSLAAVGERPWRRENPAAWLSLDLAPFVPKPPSSPRRGHLLHRCFAWKEVVSRHVWLQAEIACRGCVVAHSLAETEL